MADEDFEEVLGKQATMLASQLGAMMGEAMRPERHAYQLVGWDQVNPLAREGWQIVAMVPLVPDYPHGIAFVLGRKLGPEADAEDMLRAAAGKHVAPICPRCGTEANHPPGPYCEAPQ